jgi:hypothetical protein
VTPLLPLLIAVLPGDPVPPIALPAEVKARPGRIVKIDADTPGKVVRWVLPSDDADLIPLTADGKTVLFCSPTAGRFVVFAWTAVGDVPSDAARCVVIVGDPPPPTPPTPTDPLTADFRRLFAADPSADKAAHLAQLAVLYREAIRYADNADVKTAGELAARIRAAAGSLLPTDALTAVRKRIAEEITKFLPDDGDKPLDADTRKQAAALFARIATSLEAAR